MGRENYEVWKQLVDGTWRMLVTKDGREHFLDLKDAKRAARSEQSSTDVSQITVIERRPVMVINGAGGPAKKQPSQEGV